MGLVLGSMFNFIMYFFSDKLVLKMFRAHVVTEKEAPELYAMVDRLRQRAGLPMPVEGALPESRATRGIRARAGLAIREPQLESGPPEGFSHDT